MGAGEGEAAGSKEKSSGVARTSLDGLRDKNVMQLKKLNMALFPVRYNDKYYQDAIASKDFSKLGERAPISFFQSCSNPYLAPPGPVPYLIRSSIVLGLGLGLGLYLSQFSDLQTEGRKQFITCYQIGEETAIRNLDFGMGTCKCECGFDL